MIQIMGFNKLYINNYIAHFQEYNLNSFNYYKRNRK